MTNTATTGNRYQARIVALPYEDGIMFGVVDTFKGATSLYCTTWEDAQEEAYRANDLVR